MIKEQELLEKDDALSIIQYLIKSEAGGCLLQSQIKICTKISLTTDVKQREQPSIRFFSYPKMAKLGENFDEIV